MQKMSMKFKLGLAGCVVAITTAGILIVLLPSAAWRPSVIAATALGAVLLGGFLYLPTPLGPSGGAEEARLALLGPSSALLFFALLVTASAWTTGLFGMDAVSWALSLFAVAGLVAGALVLNASSHAIDQAAATQPNNAARIEWQGLLQEAAARFRGTPHGERYERLADDLRYSATSMKNASPIEDESIYRQLTHVLSLGLINDDIALGKATDELETLVVRRQKRLVMARSKA